VRLTTKTSPEIETSAQKCKNFRIGVFYPLSFPDFGRSAGHSILRLLQRGRKSPPYTVVIAVTSMVAWPINILMITGAIGLRYVNVIFRFPVPGPIYVDEDSWILDWTTAIMIDVRAVPRYAPTDEATHYCNVRQCSIPEVFMAAVYLISCLNQGV
jgi:hypothetical protein